MIFMVAGFGLLVLGIAGLVEFSMLPRQAALYEEIISRVEAERDYARNEANVYRRLLMPALQRTEPAAATTPATPTPPAAPARRPRSRIPFRKVFNLARQSTNTPQKCVDALAEAIEGARQLAAQHKPLEEKTHVG